MSEELRTAVLEGLRAFAEEEPDFAMSHGMRARAADFILAQPRPALEGDIVGMLRKAAAEMRSTHHAGWPNVCDAAAEALAALKDRDVVLEELLRGLSDAADEVNGAIDEQTYDEKMKMQDWSGDYEFCVNITSKQERALNAAICAAQATLKERVS